MGGPRPPKLILNINTVFGKAKGREGKERERVEERGEEREREDKFFHFPCLVCKGKMEGNTPYW